MPLSFFSSGGAYGTSVPYQRIIEPEQLGSHLSLDQAELLRLQRYNEHWRFYFGRQWLFKREDGEPLVTINYFRKFIDKIVSFLVMKGFVISVPEALEEITKPLLDEVWKCNNRDRFNYEAATMGAVTGDVFVMVTYKDPTPMERRLNPYAQGKIQIHLYGSEQVFPTWNPVDQDDLLSVRIETIYYDDGPIIENGVDNVNKLSTKRFTQIITRDTISEQYQGQEPLVRPNAIGEIPLVHIKNIPIPKEYYGLADGMDLIDLQRELNEKATDISDTIAYHSSPVTVIYGAKAKQLERGAKQVWSGLPTDARIENLKLEGDLVAAQNYWDKMKRSMHEIGDVPEGTLGQMQPISNTSGVALHMQHGPLLERRARKLATYQAGYEAINYFILRIAANQGLVDLPFNLCKCCGGKIVRIDNGKKQKKWDPELQAYVEMPVYDSKCFQVDPQTLDFLDPYDVVLKFWRQYGFGKELRQMKLSEILAEIQKGGASFWDYSAMQKEMLKRWYEANPDAIPEEGVETEEGVEVEDEEAVPVPKKTPPDIMVSNAFSMDQIEIPEEPERVLVVQEWVHPDNGSPVGTDVEERFLVPTGCKTPKYLNPFENKVEFLDVLPKDEAIQAQLYAVYQSNGWVDEEWCQSKIPAIAPYAAEIRKRSKIDSKSAQDSKNMYQEAAPAGEDIASVPGEGGNPTTEG